VTQAQRSNKGFEPAFPPRTAARPASFAGDPAGTAEPAPDGDAPSTGAREAPAFVRGFIPENGLTALVAKPLRFRVSESTWSEDRVRGALYADLDANLGAEWSRPWFRSPDGYEARRFEMDDGSIALFVWARTENRAYWLGNTETPEALWRTEKEGFDRVPYPVARWAERELLAQLREESPWLAPYSHLSWFFLPVFLSKDGRESTRAFFRDHAAGFPDADRERVLDHYESVLRTGALDEYRHEMVGKLGTPERVHVDRMAAAMSEFDAAGLLLEAGWEVTPEIEVSTGHSLDFRVERPGGNGGKLVEVTRPTPPGRRRAGTAAAALRDTAGQKTTGQLSAHAGGATLFVDCSGFPDDEWASVRAERPSVGHRPAVVYRVRPGGRVEGYRHGGRGFEFDWIAD
jgi:hypothetical protein